MSLNKWNPATNKERALIEINHWVFKIRSKAFHPTASNKRKKEKEPPRKFHRNGIGWVGENTRDISALNNNQRTDLNRSSLQQGLFRTNMEQISIRQIIKREMNRAKNLTKPKLKSNGKPTGRMNLTYQLKWKTLFLKKQKNKCLLSQRNPKLFSAQTTINSNIKETSYLKN